MLDWISDTIWSMRNSTVPAIFVDLNSPSFDAVRAMFGLLLIAIVIYAIAMMPRSGVAAWMKKMFGARRTRRDRARLNATGDSWALTERMRTLVRWASRGGGYTLPSTVP